MLMPGDSHAESSLLIYRNSAKKRWRVARMNRCCFTSCFQCTALSWLTSPLRGKGALLASDHFKNLLLFLYWLARLQHLIHPNRSGDSTLFLYPMSTRNMRCWCTYFRMQSLTSFVCFTQIQTSISSQIIEWGGYARDYGWIHHTHKTFSLLCSPTCWWQSPFCT